MSLTVCPVAIVAAPVEVAWKNLLQWERYSEKKAPTIPGPSCVGMAAPRSQLAETPWPDCPPFLGRQECSGYYGFCETAMG